MAALGEPVSLCTCLHEKDLLSVNENDLPEQVIVTCKTKSVYVFKLEDQKAVQSWSVRKEWVLTSPVRYTSDNEYITVINQQDVRIWNRDEVNFEKSERRHFKFKIYEILTARNWKPVVVCENGVVDFLDKIKESHTIKPAADGEIVACSVCCVQDTLCIVCLARQENGNLIVYHHWCNKSSLKWKSHATPYTGADGLEYVHSHTEVSGPSVRLTILYSNGEIHTLGLTEQCEEASDIITLKIFGIHEHSSMVVLDLKHVAVGVMSNAEEGIGIFDMQFGTLLTWKALPAPAQCKLKLHCHHGNLLVPCGNTLYTYSYTCQPSTVASILGQLGQNDEDQQWFGGHFTWSACTNTVKTLKNSEEVIGLFRDLCDKNKLNTLSSFTTAFSALMEKIGEETNDIWYGSPEMTELALRCVTEQKFWPRQSIETLIKHLAFSPSVLPKLVEALIKHSETDLLHMALTSIPELPESCLCEALQYYLSCETKTLIKAERRFDVECSSDKPTPHWAFFVNGVLMLPYNDVFMVECLRSLQFKHALSLLNYLQYLLEVSTSDGDCVSPSAPTMLQIVEWICLLLDAHVTQLIISPDARLLMLNLHKLVASQVKFYDDLITLDELLQQLRAKSALPKKQAVGHYCIEVLHVL